jgi:hypothetical protein
MQEYHSQKVDVPVCEFSDVIWKVRRYNLCVDHHTVAAISIVTINPYIEFCADNLPARRLGAFGIGLILCGFTLQSIQYWLVLLDVRLS